MYDKKVIELKEYEKLEDKGLIDIYFFDESGFSVTSNLPYLWSPKNNTAKVKTLSIKRINVLGFLSKYGKLSGYIAKGKVTSDEVIDVFNDFVKTLSKKTVVVVDNASIHTSKKFKANLENWQRQGLTIFYLPPYSPHLNIIETLWRFMKYTWIEYRAYLNFNNFKDYISKIFSKYGKEYKINFDSKVS